MLWPAEPMAQWTGDSSNGLLPALEELEGALVENFQLFAPMP